MALGLPAVAASGAPFRPERSVSPPASPAAAACELSGVVRGGGRTPVRLKPLTNAVDVETCGTVVGSGSLLLGRDRAVANAFVEVRRAEGRGIPGAALAAAPEPVELTFERCTLSPHVAVVPAGSAVAFSNPEGLLHDVSARSVRNEPARALLPRYRRRLVLPAQHFARPEKIPLSCARHPWAGSHLVVTDNPWHAVTGPDGRFAIADLPPGEYLVTAWHAELGTTGQQLTATPGLLHLDLVLP